MNNYFTRYIVKAFCAFLTAAGVSALLTGCSAGKSGLMQITPQQYFYSAKEKLETINERAYDIRDLDEIIRVLQSAEKDAKSGEIIDKSRMYLVLACTLKARKQYQSNILKGEYLANRPEPFFVLDVKPVQETLREAKKWLRSCEAGWKTKSLDADLQFVKGYYYTQKMLTQKGSEHRESLWTAVNAFRRCIGIAPDYKSDFRLFGKELTPREVRLKLIECLALGGEVAEAYGLVSEYTFTPMPALTPLSARADYAWMHMKGLVLAMMGRYEEAAELLKRFRIVPPQDYPTVEEALWVLEGVYDRLAETTDDDTWRMEARIVASMLKQLKGPYAKEKYTTAANIFPRWLPGDATFFEALVRFHSGDFDKAREALVPIARGGMMTRANRLFSRVLALETELYAGRRVADDLLEELLGIAVDRQLSPLLKERLGYLLARYVMGEAEAFKQGRLEGENQTFVKAILGRPWALSLKYRRGDWLKPNELPGGESGSSEKERPAPKTERGSSREKTAAGKRPAPESERLFNAFPVRESKRVPRRRDFAALVAEVYANRSEDWITSANLNLIALPQMTLLGGGRIVGREEEGKGWVFKGEDIDELRRGGRYLAIFEYADSDSAKSIQGILFEP
ncbi:MAG TPA: hypothetical protein PLU72_04345 [Candidatus Ozemobacteraceae bacterium]|nr:hypothetical protein [Candidatus Ozemobacteraceae bacterium]